MTPQERKSLAEQLLGNPLFEEILGEIERSAVETLVYAPTDEQRVIAQWRVISARSFRDDCRQAARNTVTRGAPA